MVSFGSKAGKNYKVDKQDGGAWFTTLKAGKDMRVRFLEEAYDWFKFSEHFHPTLKFFPCTGEGDCYGCNHESDQVRRKSTKYGVNALDTATGTVVPLKLPFDLSQRLFAKADRSGGSITDRDYTLWREGSGLDTKYDYDAGERQDVNIVRYKSQFHDCEKIVVKSFEDAFGKDPIDQYKAVPGSEAPAQLKKADPWMPPEGERDVDPKAPEFVSVEISDTTPKPNTSSTDVEEVTEEQLKAMSKEQLIGIAMENIGEDYGGNPWMNFTQEQLFNVLMRELG